MSKPKPCPFCGSKLVNICYHPQGCHSVECLECKIRTGEYGGFQSVDVWNKRPDYDRMTDEIEELRARITKKDEMVSDLIEALGVLVDEAAELRGNQVELLKAVKFLLSKAENLNELQSINISSMIEFNEELLNK